MMMLKKKKTCTVGWHCVYNKHRRHAALFSGRVECRLGNSQGQSRSAQGTSWRTLTTGSTIPRIPNVDYTRNGCLIRDYSNKPIMNEHTFFHVFKINSWKVSFRFSSFSSFHSQSKYIMARFSSLLALGLAFVAGVGKPSKIYPTRSYV